MSLRPVRRPFYPILLLAILFAGCAAQRNANPAPPAAPKTVRLLTVGNSFSDNAMTFLARLAEADGNKLVLARASIGGGSLKQHWAKVEQFNADPNNPAARYSNGKTLRDLLTQEPWDYVTIQQFSRISHDPSTHHPYADNLRAYIAEHAPTAELLIHQTWPYRFDHPSFDPKNHKPGLPRTQREMYDGLTAAYDMLATSLDARIIPVGDAFYRAETSRRWGFKPLKNSVDPAAFERPAVPNQPHSLHLGWHWAKTKEGEDKLIYDGTHAGIPGRYLAGCVWYEALFDRSVADNPFVPENLDPKYAKFLRKTAHEAVAARQVATPAGQ